MKNSLIQFKKLIPEFCSKQTSSHPENWTPQNPTYGHCAIVSVLALEYFGGTIVKVSLKNTPFENLKSHFFNIIDGEEADFTIQQFNNDSVYQDMPRKEQFPEEIMSYSGTQERYNILKSKYALKVK
ncbi:MAG: hypothetical protein ABIO57_00460 [Candidatus Paceibacterota bacterium]